MDDLPNGEALAQEIVAGSVLPITKIIAIKNDKLHNTFFHVAFGSQSMLKPISNQTGSDTNWRIGESNQGGGWMGANQNSSQELGLYPEIDPTSLSSNLAKTAQLYQSYQPLKTG
jgi:hypothetical protein